MRSHALLGAIGVGSAVAQSRCANASLCDLSPSLHIGDGASREVTFEPATSSVQAYDFAEATVHVASPDAMNPFTDVTVTGTFGKRGDQTRTAVEGFCDSPDGSVFRIRFVPSSPGDYTYASDVPAEWLREDG